MIRFRFLKIQIGWLIFQDSDWMVDFLEIVTNKVNIYLNGLVGYPRITHLPIVTTII